MGCMNVRVGGSEGASEHGHARGLALVLRNHTRVPMCINATERDFAPSIAMMALFVPALLNCQKLEVSPECSASRHSARSQRHMATSTSTSTTAATPDLTHYAGLKGKVVLMCNSLPPCPRPDS